MMPAPTTGHREERITFRSAWPASTPSLSKLLLPSGPDRKHRAAGKPGQGSTRGPGEPENKAPRGERPRPGWVLPRLQAHHPGQPSDCRGRAAHFSRCGPNPPPCPSPGSSPQLRLFLPASQGVSSLASSCLFLVMPEYDALMACVQMVPLPRTNTVARRIHQ